MRLFCYARDADNAVSTLLDKLRSLDCGKDMEVCRSLACLSQRLKEPTFERELAVIVAATREELDGLLAIRDLLQDIRIILVLPDHESDTVSQGHKLSPRFVSYIDRDFWDVVAVLSFCNGKL